MYEIACLFKPVPVDCEWPLTRVVSAQGTYQFISGERSIPTKCYQS